MDIWNPVMETNLFIQYRKIADNLNFKNDYVCSLVHQNYNIHRDFNIPTIREEMKNATASHLIKLYRHPYHLARNLLLFECHSHLQSSKLWIFMRTKYWLLNLVYELYC